MLRKTLRATCALILILNFFPTQSRANAEHTDLMITAGDSISAGYLSDWRAQQQGAQGPTIEDNESIDYADPVSRLIDDPVNHPRHSISEWKLRMGQKFNNKYTLSWSSGYNLQSHYVRLSEYLANHEPNTHLEVYNVAWSGAVVVDLERQADQILNAWYSGKYQNVSYITLTIGANDACAPWYVGGNPDAEWIANLRAFFKKLSVIQQKEPIRILWSSIPNIAELGKPEILNHQLTSKKSCEQRMRFQDRYCTPLMLWKTPEEHRKNVLILDHKNDMMRDLAKQLSVEYPQFQFMFSESLFKRKIKIDFLSKDCFHPNSDGQDEISEQLWADQPWFK
jgi:lysophospholipase L1-like esterase